MTVTERIDPIEAADESTVAPESAETSRGRSVMGWLNGMRNKVVMIAGLAAISGAPVDVDSSHAVEAAEMVAGSVRGELRSEKDGKAGMIKIDGKPYIVLNGKEPNSTQRANGYAFYRDNKLYFSVKGREHLVELDKQPKAVNPVVQQAGAVKEQVKNAVENDADKQHQKFEAAIDTLLEGVAPDAIVDPVKPLKEGQSMLVYNNSPKDPAIILITPAQVEEDPVYEHADLLPEAKEFELQTINITFEGEMAVASSKLTTEPMEFHVAYSLPLENNVLAMEAKTSYRGLDPGATEAPLAVAMVPVVTEAEKGKQSKGTARGKLMRLVGHGTLRQLPKELAVNVLTGKVKFTTTVTFTRAVQKNWAAKGEKIDALKNTSAAAAEKVGIAAGNKPTPQQRLKWMVQMLEEDPECVWADGIIIDSKTGKHIHTGTFIWRGGVALHNPTDMTCNPADIIVFGMGAKTPKLPDDQPAIDGPMNKDTIMEGMKIVTAQTPNGGAHALPNPKLKVTVSYPTSKILDPTKTTDLAALKSGEKKELGQKFAKFVRSHEQHQKPNAAKVAVVAGNIPMPEKQEQQQEEMK